MVIRSLLYPNKWPPSNDVNRVDAFLPSDNVTELRTTKNELSVWLADTKEDIDDAIIAMVLNKDKPCKIVGLLMDEQELKSIQINVANNEKGIALGADESILLKHRNLIDLDFWRLGYLTQYMIDLSKDSSRQVIYTKEEVTDLLNKNKGTRITTENVSDKLRNSLKW